MKRNEETVLKARKKRKPKHKKGKRIKRKVVEIPKKQTTVTQLLGLNNVCMYVCVYVCESMFGQGRVNVCACVRVCAENHVQNCNIV